MKKILIAEDEVALRSLMTHLLTAQGFQVTRVANGLEAWQEITEANFDLLITDATMPLMCGEELIEKARMVRPEMPILLISADRARIRGAAERRLPCALLAKPFRPTELVKQVGRLVGQQEPLAPVPW